MTEDQSDRKVNRFDLTLARLLALIVLAGALPTLVRVAGYPFLPSLEYSNRFAELAYISALVGGVAGFYVSAFTNCLDYSAKARNGKAISPLMRAFLIAFLPVGFAATSYSFVIEFIPMMRAVIAGESTALRYTVKDAKEWSDRKCHPKVVLQSMPIMANDVCFVPEELRQQLKPGMQIELTGRGTAAGIFYKQIRIVED